MADGEYFAYKVVDFWGDTVVEDNFVFKGNQTYKTLNFNNLPQGYYELAIYSGRGAASNAELARTSFSILKKHEYLPAENSYFGMNFHSARTFYGWNASLISECYKIGAMSIRDDYDWASTEYEKDKYSYGFPCSSLINHYNMDYIIVTGFNHPKYDNGSTPYTDSGRLGFANYSKALFDLYPKQYGKLTNMEIFNEWFGPQFGDLPDMGTVPGNADCDPKKYVLLADKTYDVVKSAYTDSKLFAGLGVDGTWNQELINAGIKNCMDAGAIHLYPDCHHQPPETSEFIKKFNKVKEEFEGFDIWITETGMNTADNGLFNMTEEEQAIYLPRTHLLLLAAGAKKIFWYELLDEGTDYVGQNAHEDNYGMMHALNSDFGAYTPKPSFVSYGVMTRIIDGLSYSGMRQNGNKFCYSFSNETDEILAVYSMEPDIITVKADSPVMVTDLMGKEKIYKPQNGTVQLNIDESVQYISGADDIIL